MRRIAIHQPQYIPYIGYFDKIDMADMFIIFDTTQFKRSEWQSRNRIKSKSGDIWLTVPVEGTGQTDLRLMLKDTRIPSDMSWQRKHITSIQRCYAKADYFHKWYRLLSDSYEFTDSWTNFTYLCYYFLRVVNVEMGIETPMVLASTFPTDLFDGTQRAAERLVRLTKYAKGDVYLSGDGGRQYLTEEDRKLFSDAGIALEYQNFKHPTYKQLYGDFMPNLSIVDLLMNEGPKSLEIMRSMR